MIHLFCAVSLDGYIADHNGGVGFLDEVPENDSAAGSSDEDEGGYDSFIAEIDTIVMGRETYAFMENVDSWPYANRTTFVVTHWPIPDPLCALDTRVVSDYSLFAKELRRRSSKGIWIVGGGQVMRGFLNAGEVDRIQITAMPVAIGGGIPMFANGDTSLQHFNLASVSPQSNGVVHLRYTKRTTVDQS